MGHFIRRLTKESSLIEPQHVDSGQNHADRREDSLDPGTRFFIARGQHRDHKHFGQVRSRIRNAAIIRDLQRMPALVQKPDQHEQCARRDAVVQHLVNRPVKADLRKREDPEHDESQMAHRRVSHQLFHIGLYHRHQRAINDADNRQRHNPHRAIPSRRREHRNRKPQNSIGTHLQHYGREHHGTGGGRLHVRIW